MAIACITSAAHSQPALAAKDSWSVFTEHGYKGYRDTATGEIKLPAQYDLAQPFATDGWARVLHRSRWHFIDRAGNVVLETDHLQCCSSITDFDAQGFAIVSASQDKWFINRHGERAIKNSFIDAAPFQSVVQANGKTIDLAIVAVATTRSANGRDERLYGAINRQGQFHIPAQYERFGAFNAQGIASVTLAQTNPNKPQFTQQFITADGNAAGELARRCGQHVLVNTAGKTQLPKTIEADCAKWLPDAGKNFTN